MQEYILKLREKLPVFTGSTWLLANAGMMVVVALWGMSFISIKIAVTEIPPITMAFLRFTLASLMLLAACRLLEPHSKIQRRDWPQVAAAGVLGITLYFICENTGVKLSTAANASLIVMVLPVITTVLEVLFFKGRLTWLRTGGMALATVGTCLAVVGQGEMDFSSAAFTGNLLMVGAMLSWALYTLVVKSLQQKYSSLLLTAGQTMVGTLGLLPLALLERSEWQAVSALVWGHVIFLAVGCSFLCYILYLYVLKHLDVTITTLYLNLVPLLGAAGGHFLLNETLHAGQLWGGALTLGAVLLVNTEHYRPKEPK